MSAATCDREGCAVEGPLPHEHCDEATCGKGRIPGAGFCAGHLYQRHAPARQAAADGDEEDAADLVDAIIPPMTWVVDGLIPTGMSVLGSAPKAGKSILALQVSAAARTGDQVLGRDVPERPVLLLSLEDGRRVTQDRLRLQLAGRKMPRGLTIRYRAPKLGEGLEEYVAAWLGDGRPDGLVWIDMLAKVRPSSGHRSGRSAYDEDYAHLGPLQEVTRAIPGSSVVVNTHDRKAGSEDWTNRITGTRGVSGVGDATIFLDVKRGEDAGILHVIGREVAEASLAVRRDYPRWEAMADVDPEARMTAERWEAFQWLESNGPAFGTAYAKDTNQSTRAAQRIFEKMYRDGVIGRGRGGYHTPDQTPVLKVVRTPGTGRKRPNGDPLRRTVVGSSGSSGTS